MYFPSIITCLTADNLALVRKEKRMPSKKQLEKMKWKYMLSKAPPIFKFLDPYQNYRLSGDLIFSTKFLGNETAYSFELLRDYKVLRQIHVREKGIILEFEDLSENYSGTTSLLQSRLKTLGNRNAFELADALEFYSDHFRNFGSSETQKLISKNSQMFLNWIDTIFEENKEDLVFLRGSKMLGDTWDYSLQYLCYNFKLLEWITTSENYFGDEFIESCLKIFFFRNFEEFNMILHTIMNKKPSAPQEKPKNLPKNMNTIIGKIKINVEMKTKFFPEEKMFFHYFFHSEKNHDQQFWDRMEAAKIQKQQRKEKKGNGQPIYCKNYIDLMKTYFVNDFKVNK